MTNPTDPPRLRTLAEGLPESLAVALGRVEDGEPSATDLEQMQRRVWLAVGLPPPAVGLADPSAIALAKPVAVAASVSAKGIGASGAWLLVPVGIATVAGGVLFRDAVFSSNGAEGVVLAPTVSTSAPAIPALPSASEKLLRPPPLPPDRKSTNTRQSAEIQAKGSRQAALAPPVSSAPDDADVTAAETEISLLTRAQQALPGNPSSALVIAAEHQRRFPGGALAQEREVIVIEALARLGRTDEARARAARFRALFPSSAHGRRIDVLLK